MATEVKWTPQSLEDIDNIASFIAKDSLYYAKVQTERFFERVKVLEQYPEFGSIVPELAISTIRQVNEGRYRIIYRIVTPQRIDILTVHHKSRLLTSNPLFSE
ncbi:MAG: type II toxin-antitoxin system RelE/ParE family toxin [Cyclobacteriaceae bacterium]|jgi:toxin ParE1/3/4|nr:type II toxin-antitoxin system RelE/ParE family toxin [Flammeovirgaceae bacterium]